MRGVIYVTDRDWFEFLAAQKNLDEVNFWRPSDTRTPQQLEPGMPVIFKLRKQHGGWIVGFGIFARHEVLRAWYAWDTFGVENGASTFEAMCDRIESLRSDGEQTASARGDYNIGCVLLTQPVFFGSGDWVAPPSDWPDNVVQGRGYELTQGEGARIWDDCLARAANYATPEIRRTLVVDGTAPRYGKPQLIRPRLGQGVFRLAVMGAYGKACAITGEHSLPALEAGHIRPFADQGPREVSNGLLMRSDIHRLFDSGYVGVSPDLRFVVSRRLKDDYENGRSYYPLHGQAIAVPKNAADHPDKTQLEWHLSQRFRG